MGFRIFSSSIIFGTSASSIALCWRCHALRSAVTMPIIDSNTMVLKPRRGTTVRLVRIWEINPCLTRIRKEPFRRCSRLRKRHNFAAKRSQLLTCHSRRGRKAQYPCQLRPRRRKAGPELQGKQPCRPSQALQRSRAAPRQFTRLRPTILHILQMLTPATEPAGLPAFKDQDPGWEKCRHQHRQPGPVRLVEDLRGAATQQLQRPPKAPDPSARPLPDRTG